MAAPVADGSFTVSDQDVSLFEPHNLTRLSNWANISEALEKNNLLARPLKLNDFENGYDQLLAQLTNVEKITRADYEKRFHEMRTVNMVEDQYAILVIEDTKTRRVVSSATLTLELKFIHQCSVRGRLEDYAILETYSGGEGGGLVIKIMIELAREVYNCYKLTVNCEDDQKRFYTDNGFTYGSNVLSIKYLVDRTDLNTPIDSAKDDVHLFDRRRLTQLFNWSEISEELGQNNLVVRPLKLSDYENGYLELLEQLTVVGAITKSEFGRRFQKIRMLNQAKNLYEIVIIEDNITERVVGASTLFLELKFIDRCSMRGRLEDVAVLDTHRGRKIGELVVKTIVQLARQVVKCSKVSLDCENHLKRFYAKNGFTDDSHMLKIKFHD